MALTVEPAFFPVNEMLAAPHGGRGAPGGGRRQPALERHPARGLGRGAQYRRRWTLAAIAGENGLDGDVLLAEADAEAVAGEYAADTAEAIERGVFGAPSYIYRGELYWGQDRLDFISRALEP